LQLRTDLRPRQLKINKSKIIESSMEEATKSKNIMNNRANTKIPNSLNDIRISIKSKLGRSKFKLKYKLHS
jgi:hypothetical protein